MADTLKWRDYNTAEHDSGLTEDEVERFFFAALLVAGHNDRKFYDFRWDVFKDRSGMDWRFSGRGKPDRNSGLHNNHPVSWPSYVTWLCQHTGENRHEVTYGSLGLR